MTRTTDIFFTALAPAVWGSTYFVRTEFLPEGYPKFQFELMDINDVLEL